MLLIEFLWWSPWLMIALARLWGGRLRFEVAIGFGRVLVAAGCPEAASKVYTREIRRAERGTRAVDGRRGW